MHNLCSEETFLKRIFIQHIQLSFQDDITSTDESEESENDENFILPSQQNHKMQQQQQQIQQQAVAQQRAFADDDGKQLLHSQQTQNHRISEKILDNNKLLLESLTNLPPNLLQSWIQSGQLQVTVDDGKITLNIIDKLIHSSHA